MADIHGSSTQNLLLYFADKEGHKDRARAHFMRDSGGRQGLAMLSLQTDFSAITDAEPLGVLGVDFDKAVRVVEQEHAQFPFQRLAMFHEDILVPIIKRMPENERHRIVERRFDISSGFRH